MPDTWVNTYKFFLADFTGVTIHIHGVASFFLNIFIAFAISTVFYLVGGKLRRLFFKENKQLNFFVNIGLGYIAVGTGIGILGFFSLLQTKILYSYLLFVGLIALYPFRPFPKVAIPVFLKNIGSQLFVKKNVIAWGVGLFILLSFLRLSVPEIEEDTYHTDLPSFYLSTHTTMLETRDPLHVIPYPQLAEMTYSIPILLGEKDAARFIHFSFYLLIIALLFTVARRKEYAFAKFAPLLFVTAPVVMRYSRAQYIDFFMVFAFLLSVMLINKGGSLKSAALSGIVFGAAIATKMWILVYLPAFVGYIGLLNRDLKIAKIVKFVAVFTASSLLVAIPWYIRSYIITGYPLYPIFAKIIDFDTNKVIAQPPASLFGFNLSMFALPNMIVLSPLFFLGLVFSLVGINSLIRKLSRSTFFIFFIAITIVQLVGKIGFGRYLLAWYTCTIIVVSAGLLFLIEKSRLANYLFIALYALVFFYYLFSSALLLPYGFGWADQNKFLTRIEERNNSSYYDFDHLFNKWIGRRDLVAMYGLYYYYYADFAHIDARYVFSKNNRTFDQLRTAGVTKLFIKDTDVSGFCKKLFLKDCKPGNAKLLATYRPNGSKVYNLYTLNW